MWGIIGAIVLVVYFIGQIPLLGLLVPEILRMWFMLPIGVMMIAYSFTRNLLISGVITLLITVITLLMGMLPI